MQDNTKTHSAKISGKDTSSEKSYATDNCCCLSYPKKNQNQMSVFHSLNSVSKNMYLKITST